MMPRRELPAALAVVAMLGRCSSWNPLVSVGIIKETAHPQSKLGAITATVTPKAVWTTQAGAASGFGFRPDGRQCRRTRR